jgi:hypothetical protein
MAQQTYTERAAAVGTVSTFDTTDLIRVSEDLVTADDFVARLIVLGSLIAGNTITAPDAVSPGLTVVSDDADPFEVRTETGSTLVGGVSTTHKAATGYSLGVNTIDRPIFVTDDRTEPASIATGDLWIRPIA